MSFLIRRSPDRSLFAAPRGLSQLVTSFIGSWCQGIRPVLFFAWTSYYSLVLWIAWVSFKQDFFVALKRFFPFRVVYPPFGEIVCLNLLRRYPFWKDSINFSILSSLICSFFQLILIQIFEFFVYLFDCQVSFALLLLRFPIASPSWDVLAIRFNFTRAWHRTLCGWSVWMDSNHRPRAYQARALATWATDRFFLIWLIQFVH